MSSHVEGIRHPLEPNPSASGALAAQRPVSQVLLTRQVFRREGEYWTVSYDGIVCRLKHTKGMQLLADLLQCPGQRVPAARLQGVLRENASREVAAALAAPVGADFRPQSTADAERARVNVTRAIKGTLQRFAAHHPSLFAHLISTVRTGSACAYLPDPRLPIRWETSAAAVGAIGRWDEV